MKEGDGLDENGEGVNGLGYAEACGSLWRAPRRSDIGDLQRESVPMRGDDHVLFAGSGTWPCSVSLRSES